MKRQAKLHVFGTVFLILALFIITIAPLLFRFLKLTAIQNYIFAQIEFFLLFMCAGFYCLAPKYYFRQIFNIIFAFLYYFLFLKFYPILF